MSLADVVRSRFDRGAGTIDIEGTSYRTRYQGGSPDWHARWRQLSPVNARIADFKSDACTPAGAADLAARYHPQMALYRQALARILRIEERRIAVDLVLLQAGMTVAVSF